MNKRNTWVAIGAVASLLVLVAGWFVVVTPVRNKTASTKTATAALDAQNATLQIQLNQLVAQYKGYTDKQAQLANIAAEIPGDPRLPHLIRDLSSAAADSGVDLTTLTPAAPTSATGATTLAPATGTGARATVTPTNAAATYQVVPVALTIQGDYPGVEEFVRHLETMKRIFLVNQLTLTPIGNQIAPPATLEHTPGGMALTPHSLSATFAGEVFMTDPSTTSISLPALSGASAPAASTTH